MANDILLEAACGTVAGPVPGGAVAPVLSNDGCLLSALLEYSTDGIYFKDLESRFIRINRQLARYFRLASPEAAMGKTDRDFFSEEHALEALRDEQEIIRTHQPLIGKEERETWPDGRITWVFTSKMPLLNEWGEVIGTFGISRDITDRHYMQEAVRESEYRFKELLGAIRDAVWIWDRTSGRTLYVSPAYETIWGRPCTSLYADAQDWQSAVVGEDRNQLLEIQASGLCEQIEATYRIERPDGEVRRIRHRGFPIFDGAGAALRTATIAADITEAQETRPRCPDPCAW